MDAREVLTRFGCVNHSYLADGVYVGWDGAGEQVWLVAERGGIWNTIALDRDALVALYRYVESIDGKV